MTMSKLTVTFLVLALLVPAAFAADPPAEQKRMLVLPGDTYKAIVAEEAKLNKTLAACKKAVDPRICRSNAMNAYGQRVEALLDEVRPSLRWGRGGGPNTLMDCLGDTKHNVATTCGGQVEQIPVPCLHCDPQHVQKTGGKCFIWACIMW